MNYFITLYIAATIISLRLYVRRWVFMSTSLKTIFNFRIYFQMSQRFLIIWDSGERVLLNVWKGMPFIFTFGLCFKVSNRFTENQIAKAISKTPLSQTPQINLNHLLVL